MHKEKNRKHKNKNLKSGLSDRMNRRYDKLAPGWVQGPEFHIPDHARLRPVILLSASGNGQS